MRNNQTALQKFNLELSVILFQIADNCNWFVF